MKKIHRVLALLMAALMAFGLMTTAFAAEPTIDASKKASLSIYKYDITKASEDGVWDAESYVSMGLHDDAVIDKLSKYAIQGVEFTYLRVADIAMNNEVMDGQRTVSVLYGFDNSERSNAVLSAIGLNASDAHKTENGINYYTSDSLNNKLAAALAANATNVKNALETAVKNGGIAMTETDTAGHTSASNMEQGLYLVVETRVPENVTSTCNPFLISLPMTTVDGSKWLYDLTVYPKNQTGNPTLSKTVREAKNSTGKHNGSLTDITDGFEHTATASVGDVVDYQIISTLPTITSKASSLSEYTYVDTMSKGIRYHKNDVDIEFFRDAACTDKITTWAEDSGKFTVAYDDTANTMTIRMTETGLAEINEATTVYTDSVKRGYSDCTMRITYAATLTADAQMGDKDNPNEVELTWKRTNTTYYDTLEDCCHVMGTSLPVGGESTHAVLSAHSGMASSKLFSDIDQLEKGDKFYIHVLGEVLAYEVDDINTVLPTDTSLLQIEEGKDYVTLVTCTPFGVNTHRLLVRGHRVPYVPEQKAASTAEKSVASSWTQHYLTGLGIGLGVVAVVGGGYFLIRRKRHA